MDKYAQVKDLIQGIYHQHKGCYGYRRIHLALKNEGVVLNSKTVQRLMAKLGLQSTVRPKKYRSYKANSGQAVANVLDRNFKTSHPDEKWATDVTEFKVKGERVYLSPVIDLHTQEVIAYKLAKHARLPLVMDMLNSAMTQLGKESKPILHSDQGWQYRHRSYKRALADKGLTQSMSRKGNCLDNAVAENFFALLKTEMYHGQSFADADDLIQKVASYIDYYNTKRIKVKLKGLTPIEYRNQALQAV